MIGTDDLRDHQARCMPHVAILQMFASNLTDVQLPADAARRVADATSAILAEARAAGRAALTAVADDDLRSANLSLLTARQARLEHAAQDAIASAREAARGGNVAALRQRLQRFDTLTSAMWTVQLSVWEHAAASKEVARLGSRGFETMPTVWLRPLGRLSWMTITNTKSTTFFPCCSASQRPAVRQFTRTANSSVLRGPHSWSRAGPGAAIASRVSNATRNW